MEEKKGIFGGALGRMILPGIILQSVLIGGGYATGREIVEYGAKFGAMGWLSGNSLALARLEPQGKPQRYIVNLDPNEQSGVLR